MSVAPPEGVKNWEWTTPRLEAAHLVAEGKLRDSAICAKVGVGETTLDMWKRHPEFQQAIADMLEEYKKSVRARALALIEGRVDTYMDDFEATNIILQERGAGEPEYQGAKGGKRTGYIVTDYKGKDADQPVYSYDAGLLRARIAIREAIQDELGQKVSKASTEISGPGGKPLTVVIAKDDEGL